MKKDITHYSENELSLLVFNTQELYSLRHEKNFLDFIDELYIYTNDQLKVLTRDLITDLEEVLYE